MYDIFLLCQCPDIQVIAIHAFHKIYMNIKMPDIEVKTKIFWCFFFNYTRERYM